MTFMIFESLYVALAAVFIGLVVLGHALLFSAIYVCLPDDWAFGRRSNRKPPLPDGALPVPPIGASRSALAAMALMSSVVLAFAQEVPIRADMAGLAQRTNSFTRICAQRDLQLLTLIEERGDAQAAAGNKLFETFLTMMRARNACIEGRESEALSIYDTAMLGLAPTRTAR